MINKWAYIRVGLYLGGGAYIWNEVSVSTCGGRMHGGLIFGGFYSRRFTVCLNKATKQKFDKRYQIPCYNSKNVLLKNEQVVV